MHANSHLLFSFFLYAVLYFFLILFSPFCHSSGYFETDELFCLVHFYHGSTFVVIYCIKKTKMLIKMNKRL